MIYCSVHFSVSCVISTEHLWLHKTVSAGVSHSEVVLQWINTCRCMRLYEYSYIYHVFVSCVQIIFTVVRNSRRVSFLIITASYPCVCVCLWKAECVVALWPCRVGWGLLRIVPTCNAHSIKLFSSNFSLTYWVACLSSLAAFFPRHQHFKQYFSIYLLFQRILLFAKLDTIYWLTIFKFVEWKSTLNTVSTQRMEPANRKIKL